jgi:hypothetical protein
MTNFIVFFAFTKFFHALHKGNTVYVAAFSRSQGDENRPALLLTSDAGVEGGTVRAVQLNFTETFKDDDKTNKALSKAFNTVQEFLESKGLRVQEGVLLTTGLNEALPNWANVPKLSIPKLRNLLRTGKDVELEP